MHLKVRKCKFQLDFSNQTFPSLNTNNNLETYTNDSKLGNSYIYIY